MSKTKIYVKVAAEFTPEGQIKPMWITWEDGRKFEIQRITDCRRAASLKAGVFAIPVSYQAVHIICFMKKIINGL